MNLSSWQQHIVTPTHSHVPRVDTGQSTIQVWTWQQARSDVAGRNDKILSVNSGGSKLKAEFNDETANEKMMQERKRAKKRAGERKPREKRNASFETKIPFPRQDPDSRP